MRSVIRKLAIKFKTDYGCVLILSLCLFHCLPFLFHYGMFFDGVTYASISRNLSEGYGSLFNLYYTDSVLKRFAEHPPIAIWFHALLYKLLGQGIWVDRLPSIINLALCMYFIKKIWFEVITSLDLKSIWWVPCLLFLVNELSFWIFRNNMLETTMAVFVLIATLCFFRGDSSIKNKWLWWLVALVMVLLGVLTKGPVGLFPIIIPYVVYIFGLRQNTGKQHLLYFIMMKIGFCLTFFALIYYVVPEMYDYLALYFKRKIASNVGHQPVGFENFDLIIDLYTKFLLWVGLLVVMRFTTKQKLKWVVDRWSFAFLCIALCGSLPVVLSQKRSLFYIFPSLAFYAFFVSFLFRDNFVDLQDRFTQWVTFKKSQITWIGCLTVSLILMFFLSGVHATHRGYIRDILSNENAAEFEGRNIGVVCPAKLTRSWATVAYAQRFHKLSFFKQSSYQAKFDYYLTSLNDAAKDCETPAGFENISHQDAKFFQLYRRVKASP